jgi:thioredoxin:protein disulfide reductase
VATAVYSAPMRARGTPFLVLAAILLFPTLAHAADDDLTSSGLLYMYIGAFGSGFITSLTPCVYPMIPITLAIFGARGENVSKRRSISLAAVYIVGMSLVYAMLGVLVATLFGATEFGQWMASPWVVIPLVLLFCALAASMFGAFQLNLPTGLQTRLSQIGGKGYRGAFAMGAVGGFIAAPCTGPALISILTFTAKTSTLGGGTALFIYGLGMGVPFFVLATAASSLPKSGPWMETVKSVAGTFMLLAALYFLRPLVPQFEQLASPRTSFLVTALALAVVGTVIGAFHLTFSDGLGHKLRKTFGIGLVLAGLFGTYLSLTAPERILPWVHDEAEAFKIARAENKGVMVDFSATWCGPCKELEVTFGHDEVYEALLKRYVPLKIDVTSVDAVNEEQQARYGRDTFPHVVFVTTEGAELARLRKLVEPDELLETLRAAKGL